MGAIAKRVYYSLKKKFKKSKYFVKELFREKVLQSHKGFKQLYLAMCHVKEEKNFVVYRYAPIYLWPVWIFIREDLFILHIFAS